MTNGEIRGIIVERLWVDRALGVLHGAAKKKLKKTEKTLQKPLDKTKEAWYTNKAVAAKAGTGIDPWKLNNRISNETCKRFVLGQTGVCRRNLVKKHIEYNSKSKKKLENSSEKGFSES